MCESQLCLQLRESLDAVFRGGVYEGEKVIRAWGHAVVDALHNRYYKCRHPRSLIWHIAHTNLQNILMNCPCEGLAQAMLYNPEAFLRTTLILAIRLPTGQKPIRPVVFH
jgi:hypothetical protein